MADTRASGASPVPGCGLGGLPLPAPAPTATPVPNSLPPRLLHAVTEIVVATNVNAWNVTVRRMHVTGAAESAIYLWDPTLRNILIEDSTITGGQAQRRPLRDGRDGDSSPGHLDRQR